MALGDALLSTFRTQQIANQQRQANQLAQQRLDESAAAWSYGAARSATGATVCQ